MDSYFAMKRCLIFSGEGDPYDWILKVEKYFRLYDIENGDYKVAYATLCMKGKALNWLQLWEAKKPIIGWEMFKHELMNRFRTKDYGSSSAYEQLLSLRQLNNSVAHYIEQFESMVAPIVRDISDDKLIKAFINGLNDDIKAEVESSMKSSGHLFRLMSLAQEIEDKLKEKNKNKAVEEEERAVVTTRDPLRCPVDHVNSSPAPTKALIRFRTTNKAVEEEEGVLVTSGVSLIFNAEHIDSSPAPIKALLRFRGKIGSREVIVLIDPFGNTHNLISKQLVTKLRIPIVKNKTRGLRLRGINGVSELISEECERVILNMCGMVMVRRFYPTDLLGIADVVLGKEWLKSMGSSCAFHFHTDPKSLTFKRQGRTAQFEMI